MIEYGKESLTKNGLKTEILAELSPTPKPETESTAKAETNQDVIVSGILSEYCAKPSELKTQIKVRILNIRK